MTHGSYAIHCRDCHSTLGIVLPGGYLRVAYKGRESLVRGLPGGVFFETTCGGRIGDRPCGRREQFVLDGSGEVTVTSLLAHRGM